MLLIGGGVVGVLIGGVASFSREAL